MSRGGKGSSPRPLSVDRQTFDDNWDLIFNKKSDIISNNEFQDVLSTENCVLDALEKLEPR